MSQIYLTINWRLLIQCSTMKVIRLFLLLFNKSKIVHCISSAVRSISFKNKSLCKLQFLSNTALICEKTFATKDSNTELSIKWRMKEKVMHNKCVWKNCNLYLAKKISITLFKRLDLLNQGDQLLSKCQHRNKFAIADIKWTKNFSRDLINNCFIFRISAERCHFLIISWMI